MPFERGVHGAIELRELARVFAEEMRAEFPQAGAHSLGIRGQIERSKRANLTVADKAGVRLDANNRAVKNGDRSAAAPLVGRLVQRKLDAVGEDAGDFHLSVV